MSVRGAIVELFSGIQGEGLHVGRRHLFLRMAGCDRDCDYCDQPEARTVPRDALLELDPGARRFMALPNPLRVNVVARAIQMLSAKCPHHALSVTGGEPLLQTAFLAALLPAVSTTALTIMLETNGTRPDDLRRLLPYLDIVSMDLKLKSATGRPMPARRHEQFLRAAATSGIETYAKAVVTDATSRREILRAAGMIAKIDATVPLVLQPVTPTGKRRAARPPSAEAVLALQQAAAGRLGDVRVIPQTHKLMGQR